LWVAVAVLNFSDRVFVFADHVSKIVARKPAGLPELTHQDPGAAAQRSGLQVDFIG
jgi:hypothetical protein